MTEDEVPSRETGVWREARLSKPERGRGRLGPRPFRRALLRLAGWLARPALLAFLAAAAVGTGARADECRTASTTAAVVPAGQLHQMLRARTDALLLNVTVAQHLQTPPADKPGMSAQTATADTCIWVYAVRMLTKTGAVVEMAFDASDLQIVTARGPRDETAIALARNLGASKSLLDHMGSADNAPSGRDGSGANAGNVSKGGTGGGTADRGSGDDGNDHGSSGSGSGGSGSGGSGGGSGNGGSGSGGGGSGNGGSGNGGSGNGGSGNGGSGSGGSGSGGSGSGGSGSGGSGSGGSGSGGSGNGGSGSGGGHDGGGHGSGHGGGGGD